MHPVRGTHPGQQPPRPVHPGGGPGTELTAHPAPQRSALGPRFGLAGQLEVRFLVGRGGEPSPSHTGPGRHPVAFAHDRGVSGGGTRALRGHAGSAAHMVGMTVTTTDRVRSLIRHSGHTQREFGERIGLDEPTMSRCLGGVRRFTSLDLARIADTNKVSVDWLLSGQMWGLSVDALIAAGDTTLHPAVVEEAQRVGAEP